MTLSLDYTATVSMRCAFGACTNDARYITIDGRFACATCPVQHKVDAVKITAVPELLQFVREYLDIEDPADATIMSAQGGVPSPRDRPSVWVKRLRLIVGQVPQP